MSHEVIRGKLDAYAEGRLDEAARRAVETHLDGCAPCREDLVALRELLEGAGRLPRSIEPSRDLWPGIETAIGAAARPGGVASGRGLRNFFGLPNAWRVGLAAAAAAAVVWSGMAVVRHWNERGAPNPVAEGPADGGDGGARPKGVPDIVILDEQARPRAAGWARMIWALEEQNYGAGKVLLATLAEGRDPEAIQRAGSVLPGVRALDAAIDETAAALRNDAENPYLARTLALHYEKKLELLRLAVRIANGHWT